MYPNQHILENFHPTFACLNSDAMAAGQAPDAQFDDEVFRLHKCLQQRRS